MFKKLKKKIKKYDQFYIARMNYLKYYKKLSIDDKCILLEAQHGEGVNGNIYYILKELSENPLYKDYKIFLSVRGRKLRKVKTFLIDHNILNVNVIMLASKTFFQILASAKYIITDTALTPNYIKKERQIYLNTWHGTPLKTLGKKVKNEPHKIGNIQKNFIQSDYLLYPNEYMKKHMIEDYMLENICKAETILLGYPRNTAFFDDASRMKIKSELNLDDKEVIVYMPTWRGGVSSVDTVKQNIYITYFLLELDKKLNDNQVMYVQLHPFVSKGINFKLFKNIKQIPGKYETYEFLNIADCLITDYSSVFIDFAIKRKKIILFTYDKEEYLKDRGMYLDMDALPFPKVNDIQELINEINSEINYDDSMFLKEFCKYESSDATKKLCEKVILGLDNEVKTEKIKDNGKENILIYVGNLAKNGITMSIKNLLKNIDTTKYNYYITFMTSAVEKYKDEIFEFPEEVKYIAITGKMNATLKSKILMRLFDKNIIKAKNYINIEKQLYKMEIKRLYNDIKFSTVIQFNGYERKKILLFSKFDANRVIFVHNNMDLEIKTKGNQRRDVLEYAYSNYDKVAVVTEDMIKPTSIFTNNTNNFCVVKNIIDYQRILENSKLDIELDENTEINIELSKLIDILNNKKYKKFINIGRYSAEKGHERLIEAFDKIWKEDKNTYLVIIGGYGKDYKSILNKIDNMESKEHIITIKSISNPYAILKKCDYFVLSSLYEGFGIVIAEADILGKPVISTDIEGPRCFMKEHKGMLVENSEDGLYNGMKKLLNNEIKVMNVDYEEYNKNAIEQFKNILK